MVSCANVFYRDVNHLLGVFTMVWFWITPIFYPLEMVPERYRLICMMNPMTPFVTLYRNTLFDGKITNRGFILLAFLWAGAFIFLGFYFFLKHKGEFIKRI